MNIGISTACLYPMVSEESTKTLLNLGYKNFEFFINSLEETTPEYLKDFKSMLDSYGAKVVSIHPYSCLIESMFFYSTYERRFTDGLKMYENYFKAGKYLGAKYFVLHGNRNWGTTTVQKQKIEEHSNIYLKISELASKYGITVCQENVNSYNSESLEYISTLKEILGERVSFVLDIKQCIRKGVDPLDMLNIMGTNLKHVHISDNDDKSDCLLPGCGTYDIEKFISELKTHNFNGTLTVEIYSSSYSKIDEIAQARQYLESLI